MEQDATRSMAGVLAPSQDATPCATTPRASSPTAHSEVLVATPPSDGEGLGNSTVRGSQHAGDRAFAARLVADYAAVENRSSATGDLLCSEESYRDVDRSTRAADTAHENNVTARENNFFRLRAQYEKAER